MILRTIRSETDNITIYKNHRRLIFIAKTRCRRNWRMRHLHICDHIEMSELSSFRPGSVIGNVDLKYFSNRQDSFLPRAARAVEQHTPPRDKRRNRCRPISGRVNPNRTVSHAARQCSQPARQHHEIPDALSECEGGRPQQAADAPDTGHRARNQPGRADRTIGSPLLHPLHSDGKGAQDDGGG